MRAKPLSFYQQQQPLKNSAASHITKRKYVGDDSLSACLKMPARPLSEVISKALKG
jgi:hypothetical protein